jgi:hypothetical protein
MMPLPPAELDPEGEEDEDEVSIYYEHPTFGRMKAPDLDRGEDKEPHAMERHGDTSGVWRKLKRRISGGYKARKRHDETMHKPYSNDAKYSTAMPLFSYGLL